MKRAIFLDFLMAHGMKIIHLTLLDKIEIPPYGFGAGISFGTRAGVFSLSYALGSQRGNPILIRAAKIHFGFISLF